MFQWLKNLFKVQPHIRPDQVDAPEEWKRHIIAETFNTGDIICGHVDKEGRPVIDWRRKPQ